MRTTLAAVAACVVMAAVGMAWGEDVKKEASKEVTLKGTMQCAKCSMGEGEKCQNALKVKEGDKEVVYYLAQNKVSKAYHKIVCESPKESVSVTGTVSEKDGKKQIEASKIE